MPQAAATSFMEPIRFSFNLCNVSLLNRFLIHIKQHSTCFVNRFFTIFNVLVILFKFSIVFLCIFTLLSFCLQNQSAELRDNSAFSAFFCNCKLKRFLFRCSRIYFSLLFTFFYLQAALFPHNLSDYARSHARQQKTGRS